jgi:hypothetical protein
MTLEIPVSNFKSVENARKLEKLNKILLEEMRK